MKIIEITDIQRGWIAGMRLFRFLADYRFLVSKYVLQNYLVLSESWKNDIFGKGGRGFQIFYPEFRFFSSLLQSHAWD